MTEENEEKPKMIELSIQMSKDINYDISIPSVITVETFPEVLKRLKAVRGMIPTENPSGNLIEGKTTNPILSLPYEEGIEVYDSYKTHMAEPKRKEFTSWLFAKYGVEYERRGTLVATMGRLKSRLIEQKEETGEKKEDSE